MLSIDLDILYLDWSKCTFLYPRWSECWSNVSFRKDDIN